MSTILKIKYKKYGFVVSALNPKNPVTGLDTQAAKEPLIAKTMRIANICQLLDIPQRSFNLSTRQF